MLSLDSRAADQLMQRVAHQKGRTTPRRWLRARDAPLEKVACSAFRRPRCGRFIRGHLRCNG